MAETEMNYSDIEKFDFADAWTHIKWTCVNPDFKNIPESPGIYRVLLLKDTEATVTIAAHQLSVHLLPGTCLSVGKSGNLHQRLASQQFSTNYCANRLGRHLAELFPQSATEIENPKDGKKYSSICKPQIKELIKQKLCIQFFYEEEWWKRDLFETYGKIFHKCIFDLGIEH